MLTFCQLILFIRKKKLLTTNYTLSTLPKTIGSFILKMELFSSQFSFFVYERNLFQLMECRTPLTWSHFLTLFTQKRLSKKVCRLHSTKSNTQCVCLGDQPQKKKWKCLPFQRDGVFDFSLVEEWSKSYHISRVSSRNIKSYLAGLFIRHSSAFGSFFRIYNERLFSREN